MDVKSPKPAAMTKITAKADFFLVDKVVRAYEIAHSNEPYCISYAFVLRLLTLQKRKQSNCG
jgi:hypothetical protein